MGDEELTVREAAQLLDVSEETVRRLFDAHELAGRRLRAGKGGWRRISRASAEEYRRRQAGEDSPTD